MLAAPRLPAVRCVVELNELLGLLGSNRADVPGSIEVGAFAQVRVVPARRHSRERLLWLAVLFVSRFVSHGAWLLLVRGESAVRAPRLPAVCGPEGCVCARYLAGWCLYV